MKLSKHIITVGTVILTPDATHIYGFEVSGLPKSMSIQMAIREYVRDRMIHELAELRKHREEL